MNTARAHAFDFSHLPQTLAKALKPPFPKPSNTGLWYLNTYEDLCNFTQNRDTGHSRETHARLVAALVYSWMPALPKQNVDAKALAGFLDTAPTLDTLRTCNSPINASWIAFSKALHFAHPCTFPIWDTRIARLFLKDAPNPNTSEPR